MVDKMYKTFDQLVEEENLWKLDTIGDAYVFATVPPLYRTAIADGVVVRGCHVIHRKQFPHVSLLPFRFFDLLQLCGGRRFGSHGTCT